MASPIPREAPVIRTVRPLSPRSMSSSGSVPTARCRRAISGGGSVGLDAGRLHLPAPMVEIVTDELRELGRRHLAELERVRRKDLLHLRRADEPLDVRPDL